MYDKAVINEQRQTESLEKGRVRHVSTAADAQTRRGTFREKEHRRAGKLAEGKTGCAVPRFFFKFLFIFVSPFVFGNSSINHTSPF